MPRDTNATLNMKILTNLLASSLLQAANAAKPHASPTGSDTSPAAAGKPS
jgi:hypothetical protein